MVAANELRIGNIVEKDGVEYVADFITIQMAHNYKPIPITPEILEKAGFVIVDHVHGYSFYTLSKSKLNKCHIDIYPEKTSWMNYTVSQCKSLHQLQNLYFALTGTELTINL